MIADGQPVDRSRRIVISAAAGLLLFSSALVAASGDSAPVMLSSTGGKDGAHWSNMAELKKAAEANEPKACAQYGEALLRGDDVAKDTAQAMLYLRLAADKGEPNAAFRLGKIYDDGEFTPKDYPKALDNYFVAAKVGVAEAQYNLGAMYVSARGVPRDFVEGLAWIIVATKNGSPPDGEQQVREQLRKTKQLQQIAAAEQRAAEILKDPSAVVLPGTTASLAVTPPKPQAPAKIDLERPPVPTKIVIAPSSSPTPDLGNTLRNGPLSLHAQSPAETEHKDSQPQKAP